MMLKKEYLDERICDTEEGADNTETYRKWITEMGKEYELPHKDIDNMTEKEAKVYKEFLEYLKTI